MSRKGILIVVSGFSGAGKGTLMKELLRNYDNYALSISATTRNPREGETDGKEYFFKTVEEFEKMIAQDELIEMCIRDRNKKRRRSVRKNDLKNPFVFAISGYKNSGKTTLITKLIPILKEKGYRVATIKHDGHDFLGDIPGRDSYRHQEAGAYATAVYSQKRFQIMKEISGITEKELIGCFPEADIILLEGLKSSSYPKYVCDFPNTIPDAWEIAEKIVSYIGHDTLIEKLIK